MATSSITRNFVVEGESQVEMFANAIEESWQESLVRNEKRVGNFHFIQTPEEWTTFIEEWKEAQRNEQ